MKPKIVTRLANIAAKLAGSDDYDPSIKPVTALEYYLDKGVDKILENKGTPEITPADVGKVLTAYPDGAGWGEGAKAYVFTLNLEPGQKEMRRVMTETEIQKFTNLVDAITNGKPYNLILKLVEPDAADVYYDLQVNALFDMYYKSIRGVFVDTDADSNYFRGVAFDLNSSEFEGVTNYTLDYIMSEDI